MGPAQRFICLVAPKEVGEIQSKRMIQHMHPCRWSKECKLPLGIESQNFIKEWEISVLQPQELNSSKTSSFPSQGWKWIFPHSLHIRTQPSQHPDFSLLIPWAAWLSPLGLLTSDTGKKYGYCFKLLNLWQPVTQQLKLTHATEVIT